MIICEDLFEIFKKNDLTFFTGVPDSVFKDWMSFLADKHNKKLTNIIACNECEATAIATGYHLATGKVGVVYMQNAGLGKAVNPLTSLCDKEVYSIPLILMIGWRGEPGNKDEPQHKKMGRIMVPLLKTLEIPYAIMPDNKEKVDLIISKAKQIAVEKNQPVAIIIKKETFTKYSSRINYKQTYEMTREEAIKTILDSLSGSEAIISTTGKASRELFEYRISKHHKPHDFYTVGSMGCASSIAFGIALQIPNRKIVILDGDGAVLMQLGTLATIGHYKPKNILHLIFDNNSHESTGGQPTVSNTVDFKKIALASGYGFAKIVYTKKQVITAINKINYLKGPAMLVIKVKNGSRLDLGRPTKTPLENKTVFMKFLEHD
ncbi:phosphonopyruvate decarboxylase [Candidatus Pacearchaeota archaeon]|nr:phosphonopyruvate decarboxylase [Candidatus Pacearchaeota archaeon]